MTSRPQTYKVAVNKLKINPFLLNNCMIDLDSKDWKLHKDDMKEIMQEKMESAFNLHGIEKEDFSPIQWSRIVESSSPFGFPLCAQLFAFDLKYRKFGIDFFLNPHAYMLSRVKGLIEDDSTKKTEGLFLLILINHIQNKLLKITEKEKCWKVLSDLQLTTELELEETHVDNLHALAKDIDRLEVFVRESPRHVYHFIHHSVQEAVQNYFVETYTTKAIEILPLHVLFPKMHRDYVLNFAPKLKSEFFKRLREELRNGNLCEVCQYEELKDNQVSKEFIEDMMKVEKDFIDILHTKDKNDIPLMHQLTLVVCEGTIQYILGHTTFKRICSDQELYNQYFYSLLACCKLQENRTLTEYILTAYSGEDIQNQFLKTNNTNASSESEEVTYLSPLHVALKHRNESAIQLLLKHKATFPHVRWQAWPFLHICCEYGVSQFCCPELLESVYEFENEKTLNPENELKRDLDYSKIKSVENEDLKDFVLKLHNLFKDPESPEMILLNLVEIPYLDITGKLILSFCSMPDVKERAEEMNKHPMNFANVDGNTVLHLYLKLYDDNEGLLEESEDEDIDSENESDCRLLSVEVCNNDSLELIKQRKAVHVNSTKHLSTIEVLCTSGIDLNMKNKSEQTPLMIEISKSRPSVEAISILLKYGADPNEDQFSQTCLNKIIKQNYKNYKISETIELLSLLIGHKAAVDKKDQNGDNLIFIELKRQNPRMKILRFLININIDMSVKDALGRNALCLALQLPNDVLQKERVVRALLISKKLNVLSRDKDGRSALGLAILDVKYHEKILQQIVDHETCAYPLHECIKENFAENIKIQALEYLMLTDPRKGNIRAVNDKHETVLITAAKSCPDMDKLFHFLMTKDIDINARDIYQNTALYYVIEANNIDLTKRSATIDLLLSKHPFVHDEDGIKDLHSPLLTALKFLIDRSYIVLTESIMHADEKSMQNSDLESPTLIMQNKDVSLNLEIVQKILDIAETDLKAYEADENKRTYLHYCASSRFSDDKALPICRRLVELGVDVDKKDKDGLTCVDMALKYSDKNYHTLMYLMSSCNLESFEIDEALQYLADNNSLNVEILKYMKENFLSRKKTRNILHYLASIGYEPKSYSKSQRDELFDVLQSCFAVDEENVDSKIPLHIAIEENSRSSCVLNFLRITKSFINKPDDDGNTALHLVLKSEREDSDVLTIVKQMIQLKVNVNSKNEMQRTPLMVAVTCLKERTSTIKAILKEKPDLNLRDREGSTILHHCIEAKKDDFTAYSLLSLFLDSGLRVPLNSKSGAGLTPLNLAATNMSYSRVLCILKLVHNKENMAVTVDKKGRSPLYNAADSLSGVHPLMVLERLIRSYIFLRQEDKPHLKTNKGYNVLEVCEKSKYRSLTDLLETKKTCEETIYNIIQKALIDVSGRLFEKSLDKFDDDFLRDNPLIPKKIETLIADSIPYLSKCRLEHLKDEVPEEDNENESSVLDLENVNNTK
ncbi:serine/threonine-protein phosphatase 6 regulatory ankyrin repeat subunit A-like [Magallana gigas]|uniref:serine/threonine-protein phosphatase 6 regulatory ankyrin repeat subunit A-like n=1 Tax=Magallana gigas TaxID=29159 RepID=UPI0033403AB0